MENGLGLVVTRQMPFRLSMTTLHFSIGSRPTVQTKLIITVTLTEVLLRYHDLSILVDYARKFDMQTGVPSCS